MNGLKIIVMNMKNYWMLKKLSDHNFKAINLKLKCNDCEGWFTQKESNDKTLEGDEE